MSSAATSGYDSSRLAVSRVARRMLVGLSVPFTVIFYALGASGMALFNVAVILTGFLAMKKLEQRGNLAASGHVFTMMVFCCIFLSSIAAGGFANPNLEWLCVVPVLAGFVSGTRGAAAWTLFLGLTTLWFWWVDGIGTPLVPQIDTHPTDALALFNRLTIMGVLTFLAATALGASSADQTARLSANEALKASTRRIEQAMAAAAAERQLSGLGQLAAGIGHEINNPLTYVSANLEMLTLLTQQGGVIDRDEFAEILDETREGTTRIAKIVEVLRLFRPEQSSEIEQVDVASVVNDCVRMADNATRYRARVTCEFEPVPPVQANAAGLGQVVLNLLLNATDAIEAGKPDAHTIAISVFQSADDWVRIHVTDTGSGVAHEDAWRIFEPFFTTKDVGQGTGIGLSMSRSIVEDFGGTLVLDVDAPTTTFCIRLRPASAASEPHT